MHQTADRNQIVKFDGRGSPPVTMSIGGKAFDDLSPCGLRPPLVSFVVICWNYAQYVAEAIASIRAQDYLHFECLVINNGSTDRSGEEIARAVGEDKRFTVVTFDENLGQLGAALWALDHIKGSFVTFVDADDVLFSTFASTHVQVHLALPKSVAITSSNPLEITADSRVLTSQYGAFGLVGGERIGFSHPETLPRLSAVSAEQFAFLSERIILRPTNEGGWCWAPGSANMFRRTVLNFCRMAGDSRKRMRAADTHFNHLCHAIAGSALICVPLSSYRQHQANYFSTSKSLPGVRQGTREFAARNGYNRRETLECVVEKTSEFNWLLPHRYWLLIDQLERVGNLPSYSDDPQIAEMFTRHISKIYKEFGAKTSVEEISKRFRCPTAEAIFETGLSPSEYRNVQKYLRRTKFRRFTSSLKRKLSFAR